MKKMRGKDLTPEIVKQLSGLNTVEEAVKYLNEQGYEISDEAADRLMRQVKKAVELSDSALDKVAGGAGSDEDDDEEWPEDWWEKEYLARYDTWGLGYVIDFSRS